MRTRTRQLRWVVVALVVVVGAASLVMARNTGRETREFEPFEPNREAFTALAEQALAEAPASWSWTDWGETRRNMPPGVQRSMMALGVGLVRSNATTYEVLLSDQRRRGEHLVYRPSSPPAPEAWEWEDLRNGWYRLP